MDKIYRFSPINNDREMDEVFEYVATNLEKLSEKIFGEILPITTLKVFAHYPDEYTYMNKSILNKGKKASISSDTSLYVETNQKFNKYNIKYLGIRIVDPYRMQVGCGDYEIENFEEFKRKWLGKSDFIRSFREDMIEIWHPDFDVFGYIVPVL